MVNHERSSAFIAVTCQCGRALRAKSEQVGMEVRCWDCQRMVAVPDPHQGQRVARELSDGALVVMQGPGLHTLLAGAAVVTAVLAIPTHGVWCSAIALTLGASAYGEIIRRVSRGATDRPDPGWLASLVPRSIPKLILCLLMAAGTVAPLWFLNAGHHQSPRWDGLGRSIAAATWVLVPLLMLMVCGRTHQDSPLGVRKCLQLPVKHPMAMLLALAVVPFTLALVEIALGLIFYLPGNLPFFALDFMPMPSISEQPVVYEGIPYYHLIDYRSYPPDKFIAGYFDGLRHGYSFVGAIPASLSSSTRAGLNGEAIGLDKTIYTMARVLLVMVVVTCLLAAFAIQARWLGAIPSLEKRRPA